MGVNELNFTIGHRRYVICAVALIIVFSNAATAIAVACSGTSTFKMSKSSLQPSIDEIEKPLAMIRYGVENLADNLSGDHPGKYIFRPTLRQLQSKADDFFTVNEVKVQRGTYCGNQIPNQIDPTIEEDGCTYCKLNSQNEQDNCASEYKKLRAAIKQLTFGDEMNPPEGVVCFMSDLIDAGAPFEQVDAAKNLSLALLATLGTLDGDPSQMYTLQQFRDRR
jgi:hypothetical protein